MESNESIRVLIVEDEDRLRTSTEALLKKRGFSMKAVANGPSAIEEIRRESFDVVVLDLKMPGQHGNETLSEIKRIKPEVEVIILTGHGSYEAASSSLRKGVFHFLTKPCDIELLALKIREAFAKKRNLAQTESRIRDIMVPLSEFSTIREDQTVAEAVETLAHSFAKAMVTSTLLETVHRSVLVLDSRARVIGVLNFQDLLRALYPPALRRTRKNPPLAEERPQEELQGSPGLFTVMAQDILRQPVRELMSEVPPVIDADASLMEATRQLILLKVPRLLVLEGERPIGVVREQDLFFEIVATLRQPR